MLDHLKGTVYIYISRTVYKPAKGVNRKTKKRRSKKYRVSLGKYFAY